MELHELGQHTIDGVPTTSQLLPGARPAEGSSDRFAAMLSQAAAAVVQPQQAAAGAVEQFTRGAEGELHQTMLAQERAEVTLKFFVSVRNRCLEAYREIMRMGS